MCTLLVLFVAGVAVAGACFFSDAQDLLATIACISLAFALAFPPFKEAPHITVGMVLAPLAGFAASVILYKLWMRYG